MKWLEEILTNAGVEASEELMNAIKAELPKHFKPADEFNARKTEIDSLKQQLEQRDKDLKELKKNTPEDLTQKLSELQKKYDNDTKSLNDQMAELKMSNAIKMSIAKDSKDVDIVAGLLDRTKLTLKEDGTVEGLADQVKELRASKSFLFNAEDNNGYKGPYGGNSQGASDISGFNFDFQKINNYGGK